MTSSPHCQISTLVDLVADRLRNSNWVVVFKALIVSHNLMSLGNEVSSVVHLFDNLTQRRVLKTVHKYLLSMEGGEGEGWYWASIVFCSCTDVLLHISK